MPAYKLQGEKAETQNIASLQGLNIAIENRKGSVRKGVDADGNEWRTKMKHPYGYIRKTRGADGEHVDCFIGSDEDTDTAYVIHIKNPDTGKYDEDKVMLGFKTQAEALKSFREHYDTPLKFFIGIDPIRVGKLKEKLEKDYKDGRRTRMLKAAQDYFVQGFIDCIIKCMKGK